MITMRVNKYQVSDSLPQKFRGIKFGVQSNQDIVNQAVLEVSHSDFYDIRNGRVPFSHSALDPRLVGFPRMGQHGWYSYLICLIGHL
jgi:DNA-directed RNA polymerase III subunit RPC1